MIGSPPYLLYIIGKIIHFKFGIHTYEHYYILIITHYILYNLDDERKQLISYSYEDIYLCNNYLINNY